MSTRKPGSLVVAPSSKPGNGTLWRDIHSVDGAFSPAYVGDALESDAVLFAAAPDLLAALHVITDWATRPEIVDWLNRSGVLANYGEAVIGARAAIAKAGGAL